MKFLRHTLFILLTFIFQAAFVTQASAEESGYESDKLEVIFETTMGSFTLELYYKKAPKTVKNFLMYVDEGFYTNTLFHRVIPKFMVQGGGFKKGMTQKQTHSSVINESDNGIRNLRGTISMARTRSPNSATSQFFINVKQNISLDASGGKPGYTVFGKVTEGMKEVVDKIVKVPTTTSGSYKDVPKDDVVILSVKRKGIATAFAGMDGGFVAGEHYIVLDEPVATRDSSKIEVIEMFSYGCPHCYEFEPMVKNWSSEQGSDVDFWFFPAVWSSSMKLLAKAFYVAHELKVADKIHMPLFSRVVLEQQSVRNEKDLADLFEKYGVDRKVFSETFNSEEIDKKVKQSEERVRNYKPVGVPEIVINGKYRIDRMHAGGPAGMLAVADFLINKERAALKK